MSTLQQLFEQRSPKPRKKILGVISQRFSPRVFNHEEIPDDVMATIFEAARWAPSGRNHQPWLYHWMKKGSEAYKKLITCIPERNGWALSAPILILTSYNPEEPIDGTNKWAEYDLGAANFSLILQAQELGYYARQIGSFDTKKTKEILDIENPYIPFVLIALGKIGNEDDYANADPQILEKELQANTRKDKIATELK